MSKTASRTDVGELLRRYLQNRADLGDPALIFGGLDRAEAIRRVDRLARAAIPTPATAAAAPVLEGTERLARSATADEILALPDLSSVRTVAESCRRCSLHETRTHVVFGEGDPGADVVCVGEAPGAVEDETGRPFVGRAGQLLDRLLLSIGFQREDVYICNVLKSRPPRNRDPLPEEIEACWPFLLRQLELIDPRVIIAFGAFAARTLLDTRDALGRMRGRVHEFRGFPVIVTYHPAALLRNPGWTRATWEDLQRVRRLVDDGDDRNSEGDGPAAGAGVLAAPAGGFIDEAPDRAGPTSPGLASEPDQGGLFG